MKRSSNLWDPNGPIKRHRNQTHPQGQFNGQPYRNFQVQIPGAPYNGIPMDIQRGIQRGIQMGQQMGVPGPGPSGGRGYRPPTSFHAGFRQFSEPHSNPRYNSRQNHNFDARSHSPHRNLPVNSSPSDSAAKIENEREEGGGGGGGADPFPKITKSMMDYVRSHGQSAELLDTKFKLREQFEQNMRRLFPNCDLYIFGSSASGYGSKSSDMDMCLVTNNNVHLKDVKLLYRVKSVLCSLHPLADVQVINAKVPILKFVHKPTEIQCDLNINNSDGVRNTHLLKFFTKCDPRFVPLVLTLKRWARHHKINDASQGTLSSYALTLMMLHYLQVGVQPPVLPNLIQQNPEVFHPRRALQSLSFHDPINGSFVSHNKSTVGELFVGFLTYFSQHFRYDFMGISVREARAVAKRTSKEFSKWIYIEEPYNMDNVARAVRKNFEPYIKRVIDQSFSIISQSKDLDSILNFSLDVRDQAPAAAPTTSASPPKKLMESPVDKEFGNLDGSSATSGKSVHSRKSPDATDSDPSTASEVSELYELATKRSLVVTFDVIGESGSPHMKTFSTRCNAIQKKGLSETLLVSRGNGSNKKASKTAAAKAMLELLDQKKTDVSKKESFP